MRATSFIMHSSESAKCVVKSKNCSAFSLTCKACAWLSLLSLIMLLMQPSVAYISTFPVLIFSFMLATIKVWNMCL